MNNGYDNAGDANGTPHLRTSRSKFSEHGSDSDEGGLRQLRSLRSALTIAVESYPRPEGHPVNQDVHEHENSNSGPGPVWVRGCSCQVKAPIHRQ